MQGTLSGYLADVNFLHFRLLDVPETGCGDKQKLTSKYVN
jgi:hypothetical protein